MTSAAEQDLEKKLKENPVLPVLPLRNTLLFPDMIIPLAVGRDKSLKAVEQATRGEGYLLILSQKDGDVEEPGQDDLYRVGVIAKILRLMRVAPNNLSVIVHGQGKVRVESFTPEESFFEARVGFLENLPGIPIEVEALQKNILAQYEKLASLVPSIPQEMVAPLQRYEDANRVVDTISFNLSIALAEKQAILEETDTIQRLKMLTGILARELQVVELGSKIQSEVIDKLNKAQRDYFLKEQMKAIQKELGEGDDRGREVDELKARVAKAKMPKEAEEVALKEVDRLAMMHPSAAEYTVSRTYLDWLVELPWSKSTKDRLDIERAQRFLDEDHYGLEKVKDRIIEYLAVQQLKKDLKGPILCLVGPPGVGKTSLGRSVARSLGRKFVRMSLGGIRDEAEIRGHRRTYVGALPGRIIQGMRKAGSHNPVMMLDELDKVGMDFRGDPTSALLEVLDPEQNNAFVDHYVDVPFDLSKVFFITTANVTHTIPPALLDRMEVISFSGYTLPEKLSIAKGYLIPKQRKSHGLRAKDLEFTDDGLSFIIDGYTREAGVRNLEREVASVCRKVAHKVVKEHRRAHEVVNSAKAEEYLGVARFKTRKVLPGDEVGISVGLAWTQNGGDILLVESSLMQGKGELILTGQLGEVMQESARAALSFIRGQSEHLGLARDFYSNHDVHIHVPEGAIPKDGPSAGIALGVAMISTFTGMPVRHDVAMTGEITLRGKVLPVGGLKEKILAAKQHDITEVILPRDNEKDVSEVPESLRQGMAFHFVESLEEVIGHAFRKDPYRSHPSLLLEKPDAAQPEKRP